MSTMYKIMSTVKAHMNENDQIVSPTQTLLKNQILRTSEFMPQKVREKIVDANVVIEPNSVCPNQICKGDIYVETSNALSLLEQRQLLTGMRKISHSCFEPLLSPLVLRCAPDVMPQPALPDTIYVPKQPISEYKETDSAFLGVHTVVSFANGRLPQDTFLKSDSVIKSLNKELTGIGLKPVFVDSSVCKQHAPVERDVFIVLQKTRRLKETTQDDLQQRIITGLHAPKLNISDVKSVQMVPVAGKTGLIGTLSLENVQMAGKRVREQMLHTNDFNDAILSFVAMEQNEMFANGISSDGMTAIRKCMTKFPVPRGPRLAHPLFTDSVSMSYNDTFESSLESGLSTKWQPANAIMINMSGDKDAIQMFRKNISDIKIHMNDMLGCDESKPIVKGILLGAKTRIQDTGFQSVYLMCDSPDKHDLETCFKTALSMYSGFQDVTISQNNVQPLLMDMPAAKPVKHVIFTKTHDTKLNDISINQTKERQMSL